MSLSPTATLFLTMVGMTFIMFTMKRYFASKRQRVAYVPGKWARLRERMSDPQWRKYGGVLFAGKMAGIALVGVAVYYFNPGLFGHKVFAADPKLKGNDIVNPVNTMWTLVAAFLVFAHAGGFHDAGGRLLPFA